jgi:hypothetical protein
MPALNNPVVPSLQYDRLLCEDGALLDIEGYLGNIACEYNLQLTDVANRVVSMFPARWAALSALSSTGLLYSIITGLANSLESIFQQIYYSIYQMRVDSATDQNLDRLSNDLLGPYWPRLSGESDDAFRVRLLWLIQSKQNTCAAIAAIIQQYLTWYYPTSFSQGTYNVTCWDLMTNPLPAGVYGIAAPRFVIQIQYVNAKSNGFYLNRTFSSHLNRETFVTHRASLPTFDAFALGRSHLNRGNHILSSRNGSTFSSLSTQVTDPNILAIANRTKAAGTVPTVLATSI